MRDAAAELELLEIADRPDIDGVLIRGSLRRGAEVLAEGRYARVLAFSQLYIGAPILTVEIEGQVAILTLHVPDPDIQDEWLVICEAGAKVLVDLA